MDVTEDGELAPNGQGAPVGDMPGGEAVQASRSEDVGAADKPAYPPASTLPTQLDAAAGIRFDFNMVARVLPPPPETGKWQVRLRDLNTGNILFESVNEGAFVASSKHHYVRFAIDAWRIDDAGQAVQTLTQEYDCRSKDVLMQFPIGTWATYWAGSPMQRCLPRVGSWSMASFLVGPLIMIYPTPISGNCVLDDYCVVYFSQQGCRYTLHDETGRTLRSSMEFILPIGKIVACLSINS